MTEHAAPLARSYLFAPASNERILSKVLTAGADAVIVDLEDAVAGSAKARARDAVVDWLAALAPRGADPLLPPVYVRVNQQDGHVDALDLTAAVAPALTGIAVPKVESAATLVALDADLARLEEEQGLPVGSTRVLPFVETAVGVLAARSIAAASPRIDRITYGAVDLVADLGARGAPGGLATEHAAGHLVLAARAAGSGPPIEAVHTLLDDEEGLRASTWRAAERGYFGRLVIHPRQLAVVHEVFTPDADEVARAERIVTALRDAEAEGSGVVALDGRLIERPVVAAAERVLALSRRHGTRPTG